MVGYVINEDFPLTIKVELLLIALHIAPPKLAMLLPNITLLSPLIVTVEL